MRYPVRDHHYLVLPLDPGRKEDPHFPAETSVAVVMILSATCFAIFHPCFLSSSGEVTFRVVASLPESIVPIPAP